MLKFGIKPILLKKAFTAIPCKNFGLHCPSLSLSKHSVINFVMNHCPKFHYQSFSVSVQRDLLSSGRSPGNYCAKAIVFSRPGLDLELHTGIAGDFGAYMVIGMSDLLTRWFVGSRLEIASITVFRLFCFPVGRTPRMVKRSVLFSAFTGGFCRTAICFNRQFLL